MEEGEVSSLECRKVSMIASTDVDASDIILNTGDTIERHRDA